MPFEKKFYYILAISVKVSNGMYLKTHFPVPPVLELSAMPLKVVYAKHCTAFSSECRNHRKGAGHNVTLIVIAFVGNLKALCDTNCQDLPSRC